MKDRIRKDDLKEKVMSAESAAMLIKDGMIVATSGFTPSGYPKAVPLALEKRVNEGESIGITVLCGASVGDELDGALTRCGVMKRRYPYQTNNDLRNVFLEKSM